MALPEQLQHLSLPMVAAPMFLASGPQLVIETCKAGAVGAFPALNRRDSQGFEQWLVDIRSALADYESATGTQAAPYAANLIVHKSNGRLDADLALCVKHKVPIVITSLGAASSVVDAVHQYGGLVFHDVISIRHARKAAAANVDGLIAVTAGAGGHAGSINPFALVAEIRQFFDKTLLLAGAMSSGRDIAAAQMMGADLAYMGTRFLATEECQVSDAYKQMVIDSTANDIIYTPKISGVNANFLRASLERAGLDPDSLKHESTGLNLQSASGQKHDGAWRDIWSAGQGVGSISGKSLAGDLIEQLKQEYLKALEQGQQHYLKYRTISN